MAQAIGGEPMKLGLDLRGGVHFLMEVDMDTALGKLQEQNMDGLRNDLRQEGIAYSSIRKAIFTAWKFASVTRTIVAGIVS